MSFILRANDSIVLPALWRRRPSLSLSFSGVYVIATYSLSFSFAVSKSVLYCIPRWRAASNESVSNSSSNKLVRFSSGIFDSDMYNTTRASQAFKLGLRFGSYGFGARMPMRRMDLTVSSSMSAAAYNAPDVPGRGGISTISEAGVLDSGTSELLVSEVLLVLVVNVVSIDVVCSDMCGIMRYIGRRGKQNCR